MNEQLHPDVSVSGQLSADDIRQLHKNGIKTIINNRPDGEATDQPTSQALAKVCEELGICYEQIAFAGGAMTLEHVQAFADFYNQCPKPVHLFCRSGNRSTGIFSQALQMDLLDD